MGYQFIYQILLVSVVLKFLIIFKIMEKRLFNRYSSQSWRKIFQYTQLKPQMKSQALFIANVNHLRALFEIFIVILTIALIASCMHFIF